MVADIGRADISICRAIGALDAAHYLSPHADCIFTDWTGLGSPLSIHYQSVANIENTVFRNMRLAVEVADVSYAGAVRLANARFANVTLLYDRVVSTTANDYQQAEGHFLLYYADDDAAYDVPLAPVPELQRSAHGESYMVQDAVMSDCVWLQAAPDDVLPGCPKGSAAARARVRAREDPALFPGISMQGFGASGEAPLAGAPLAVEHGGAFAPGPSGRTGDYSSDEYGGSTEYAVYDAYGGAGYSMGDYVDYELSFEDYKLANDPGRRFDERLLSASDEWLQRVREVRLRVLLNGCIQTMHMHQCGTRDGLKGCIITDVRRSSWHPTTSCVTGCRFTL